MNNEEAKNQPAALWEKAKSMYLGTLNGEDEKSQAERYFSMVATVSFENGKFTIITTNSFAADLIRSEYASKIKGSFLLAGADPGIEIEVRYDSSLKPVDEKPAFQRNPGYADSTTSTRAPSSFVSTLPLKEEFTFDEFVSGPSNSFAIAAAKAVVASPGRPGNNPLFIHGGTGLGKTHLMQAIGNELKKKNPSLSICYLTAEEYMNEYVNHMQEGKISKFRDKYRSLDVLLIDDVQFFQRGKETQDEFFNNFNALRDKYKQIVLTSDVAPKNLPSTIESRLISRFEGGMLQEIESPKYETRLAILKKKAESTSVRIPDLALEYIADNINSHVRALEGALATVEVFVSANPKLVLDKTILARILDPFIKKENTLKKLTLKEIQQECARHFNSSMDEILSHERTQSMVTPRQLAMYISRKYTAKGLKEIATAFEKSHATVISGVKTIQQRLSNEPNLRADLEEILSVLGYKLSDSME